MKGLDFEAFEAVMGAVDALRAERDRARDLACSLEAELARARVDCRHIAGLIGSSLGAVDFIGRIDEGDVVEARELALRVSRGAE